MENTWIAGVFGLLGSIVGGLITYLSSIHLEKKRTEREGKVLAESFVAEISSILYLLRVHNYSEGLALAIQRTSQGIPMAMVWPVKRDYCRVFNSNVSKIGLLEVGASDVVRFYNLVQSLLEDLDVLDLDIQDVFRNGRQDEVIWNAYADRYKNIRGKLLVLLSDGDLVLKKITTTSLR